MRLHDRRHNGIAVGDGAFGIDSREISVVQAFEVGVVHLREAALFQERPIVPAGMPKASTSLLSQRSRRILLTSPCFTVPSSSEVYI